MGPVECVIFFIMLLVLVTGKQNSLMPLNLSKRTARMKETAFESRNLSGDDDVGDDPIDANIEAGAENPDLYQGDMKLTKAQREKINETNNELIQMGSFIESTYHWPKQGEYVKIPYVISASFSDDVLGTILRAFSEFEEHTCIRIVPRTSEATYINIIESTGCWSYVGKVFPNAQNLSIGRGCGQIGVVIHEFMHAIGYFHEQSRSDRDQHIQILWDNIKDGREGNFAKCDNCDLQGLPYDKQSVMHYHSTAFSKNGKPTIKALSGSQILGQYEGFSPLDIEGINIAYDCSSDPSPSLSNDNKGCWTIGSEKLCMESKDGRRGQSYSDSPCQWCCGDACTSNNNKCEPKAWLLRQTSYIGHSSNGVGYNTCPNPSLSNANNGCWTIKSEKLCMESKDGRRGKTYSDSPCQWCCGDACTGNNANTCEPKEWLLRQTNYIGHSTNGVGYNTCPSLSNANEGCWTIKSEKLCMESKDGRRGKTYSDSPCQWCCGDACTGNNANTCEPKEWLLRQTNYIGHSKNGDGYDTCPNPSLSNANNGCWEIQSETLCMESKDGRRDKSYSDSPCQWCCGDACTGNNGNKCEPKEWLLRQPNYINHSKNGVGYSTCGQ